MFDLDQIEELFKNTDLIKSKKMIEALLHNTRMLQNPNLTPKQKAMAEANIKAITAGGKPVSPSPKPAKIKPENVAPVAAPPVQPVAAPPVQPAAPAPVAQPGQIKLKYSPAYQHYGVTEDQWNSAPPEAHQGLFAHHNEVMAGKHPNLMHIKNAVEQSKAKMIKSVDQLYDLFSQLKKHL